MKLRIKFRKYGPVRFIGHLDVMRFFQKANRRAELDVAYTGGFSPHQIMSFAAPLGVGLTSNGEYMDLEVHSLTSCEDVKQRLNAASVPGIEITSVKILRLLAVLRTACKFFLLYSDSQITSVELSEITVMARSKQGASF